MCHTPSSNQDDEPFEPMDELDSSGVIEQYINPDDEPERIESVITPHGIMQLMPPRPIEPRELSPEEQQEAAFRYMQEKYGQNIPPEVAERQIGTYDKMVHRNPDGSDPLVQEPKGKP